MSRLPWTAIDGWLSVAEGEALQCLATGRAVLELGAWKGRSTVCLAAVARRVVSVDAHRGDPATGPADTYAEYLANVTASGSLDRITPVLLRFQDLVDLGPRFDLVFVDGAHDADSVEHDTRLALQFIRPGGTIAWHDLGYESVREGLQRLGLAPAALVGSLGWLTFSEVS